LELVEGTIREIYGLPRVEIREIYASSYAASLGVRVRPIGIRMGLRGFSPKARQFVWFMPVPMQLHSACVAGP
jgi:hypothetical protein